jgi:hypothetical protein
MRGSYSGKWHGRYLFSNRVVYQIRVGPLSNYFFDVPKYKGSLKEQLSGRAVYQIREVSQTKNFIIFQVGLRWWNCINEAGDSEWVFEARNGDSQSRLSRGEVRLFWIALVLAPAFWVLFLLTALFR